jgi:hypothetical protein
LLALAHSADGGEGWRDALRLQGAPLCRRPHGQLSPADERGQAVRALGKDAGADDRQGCRGARYSGRPTAGAWEAQTEESQAFLLKIAGEVSTRIANDPADAYDYLDSQNLDSDEKTALWTRLDSKTRTALKKAHSAKTHKEAA